MILLKRLLGTFVVLVVAAVVAIYWVLRPATAPDA